MTRLGLLVVALSLALGTAAQSVQLEPIVSGVPSPVAIAHTSDSRLFIVLQAGQIVIWDGTRLLPQTFLDIRSLVRSGGEQGLLGLAFHPLYRRNGYFYVNYTNLSNDTVIARYSVSATDPNRADPASAKILLVVDQPFTNHNGGQLEFGPDGYLYIGLGDGGSQDDPSNRAQNLGELLGKILRIDVDRGSPYAIPPANPFVSVSGARGEIWAYGLRNPWRFSFDGASGDLWIADVGQGTREEIDFQPATSIGGENYGWRLMEGSSCHIPPGSSCNAAGNLVLPVIEYGHTDGACSVTGGYVYRGSRYPRLYGLYLYADYCNGKIWGAARSDNGTVTSELLIDTGFRITTFGEDFEGEIYIADYQGGRVLQVRDISFPGRRRSVRH
jgi:glucose/arabinose dehydrogenase